ncbi:unnamed protein product [Dicrocoelium dendriticum]|nr:unnamed protein product [Dicrocoelium dendriticum]CAH8668516.1 unnamed protein product [Dicrocoelium dendriticum]
MLQVRDSTIVTRPFEFAQMNCLKYWPNEYLSTSTAAHSEQLDGSVGILYGFLITGAVLVIFYLITR